MSLTHSISITTYKTVEYTYVFENVNIISLNHLQRIKFTHASD